MCAFERSEKGMEFNMNLFINASNREKNCFKILKNIMKKDDCLISLSGKNIEFCKGCNKCSTNLENYCVISDYMKEIYSKMVEADKIIIASPIYMNFINGLLKNLIDRLNPYFAHSELLKNKEIYLILIGQLTEEENKETVDMITKYFDSLTEFMEFNFHFLGYISSGIIEEIDDIEKNNANYKEIIEKIRKSI